MEEEEGDMRGGMDSVLGVKEALEGDPVEGRRGFVVMMPAALIRGISL
jgi:hypothetical protein